MCKKNVIKVVTYTFALTMISAIPPDGFIEDVINNNVRNAIRNRTLLWPNGRVPYIISNSYSRRERNIIDSAIAEYHLKTCIKFKKRTNQKDYIHIRKLSGCSSLVGRQGRGQQVSLGHGCLYKGIVEHELMHTLGFWHEQSRSDRDENVKILWNNIKPNMKFNFVKYNQTEIQHLNAPYDTCSVMHYSATAFSQDGSPTIKKRKDGKCQCKLGQRNGLSKIDVKKINTLYNCRGYPQTTGSGKPKPTKPKPTTGEIIKPDLSCTDSNEYCATWAVNGECKENPDWMLENCPVACKKCKNKCADHDPDCNEFKQNGECTKSPEYMNVYCARSCGICKTEICNDQSRYCDAWAKRGHCKNLTHISYMRRNCRKACGFC